MILIIFVLWFVYSDMYSFDASLLSVQFNSIQFKGALLACKF